MLKERWSLKFTGKNIKAMVTVDIASNEILRIADEEDASPSLMSLIDLNSLY